MEINMKRILLFLALLPFSVFAALTGKVVSIHDGDTLTLLTEQNQQNQKVRLAEIDTPICPAVRLQIPPDVSWHGLQQTDLVDVTDTDRYGRKVGKIYIDNTWVNREMVKQVRLGLSPI